MKSSTQENIPKIMMCAPKYFDVQYVINPWMEHNINTLNKIKAETQWYQLHALIKEHTQVEVIEPQENLLDMVFIANAGLAVGNKCVIANFRYAERKGETSFWRDLFVSKGYEIMSLPPELFFEGEGDALYDGTRNCIWAGYGKRSHREVYPQIGDFLEAEVVYLELVDEHFYHVDTCISVLPQGNIMYVPEAFSEQSRKRIEARVAQKNRIEVSLAEARFFSCNTVPLGDTIICNKASERIKEALTTRGFRLLETDLSEFIKSGGASKCLVLTLYQK